MTGELLNWDCWVDGREDYGIEGGGMMCVMFVEQEVGGIRLSQGLKFSLN